MSVGSTISYNFGSSKFKLNIVEFCKALNVDPPEILGNVCAASDRVWKRDIKAAVKERFPKILDAKEKETSFNLQRSIDLPFVLKRFQELSGIRFEKRVIKAAKASELVLAPYDLREMNVVYVYR